MQALPFRSFHICFGLFSLYFTKKKSITAHFKHFCHTVINHLRDLCKVLHFVCLVNRQPVDFNSTLKLVFITNSKLHVFSTCEYIKPYLSSGYCKHISWTFVVFGSLIPPVIYQIVWISILSAIFVESCRNLTFCSRQTYKLKNKLVRDGFTACVIHDAVKL